METNEETNEMTKAKNKLRWKVGLFAIGMLVLTLGGFAMMTSAADGDGCAERTCEGRYANGFCTVCDGTEAPTQDGDGYYEIDNAGKLYWFAEHVNAGNTSANAKLTKNIAVNPGTFASDGSYTSQSEERVRDWTPIGIEDGYYAGKFDGNGHTVSGLHLKKTTSAEGYGGLFLGLGEGAEVRNVGVVNSYFYGYWHTGAIAGTVKENATVENCFNSGYVTGSYYIAGVVGSNYGTISRCYNSGTINGVWAGTRNDQSIGGVIGGSIQGAVENCYNTGTVVGYSYVGGIAGYASATSIKNSYNVGDIGNSSSLFSGGIVGHSLDIYIENCFNSGTVTGGTNMVAGIAGAMSGGNIKTCYNTGSVTGNRHTVGGIVGKIYTGSVYHCYNTGTIRGGSDSVGAIVGAVETSYTASKCYYLAGCAEDGEGKTQNGFGFYRVGQDLDDVTGECASVTTAQIEGGALAYQMNLDLAELVFGQKLGVDSSPVFYLADDPQTTDTNESNRVYLAGLCSSSETKTYTNVEMDILHDSTLVGSEHYSAEGACLYCGLLCEHPSYEEGVCTVCEVACRHPHRTEEEVCRSCNMQVIAKIGDAYFIDLSEALVRWENNSELLLLANITHDERIVVKDKEVILNLNGHTLDMSSCYVAIIVGEAVPYGGSHGVLKIRDTAGGGMLKAEQTSVNVWGRLYLESGTLIGGVVIEAGWGAVISGGQVEVSEAYSPAIYVSDRAGLVMSGGKVSGRCGIFLRENASLSISGSPTVEGVDADADTPGFALYMEGIASVTIDGTPTLRGDSLGAEIFTKSKIKLGAQPPEGEIWRIRIEEDALAQLEGGIFATPNEGTDLDADRFSAAIPSYYIEKNSDGALKWILCTTHSGGTATCVSAKYCERCSLAYGEPNPEAHTWDEGAITVEPSCTEKGELLFTCIHDGTHTKKEVVVPLGHTEEVVKGREATCKASGLTDGLTCSVCGAELLSQEEIPMIGHEYDHACDATCNTCGEERAPADHVDGDENKACDICGAELPKDGVSGGAIAGIVMGSVAVVGLGGFSIFWFVIKKKRWSDLVAIFKKNENQTND